MNRDSGEYVIINYTIKPFPDKGINKEERRKISFPAAFKKSKIVIRWRYSPMIRITVEQPAVTETQVIGM